MKHLMSGNEATARGVYEAGIKVCSAYPGTPSTEILENLPQYGQEVYCEWAPNEKVATEVAYGASVAGSRAFCTMKMVGLNVAADPLFTAGYMGVNGAYVVVTADDPSCHSSQNAASSTNTTTVTANADCSTPPKPVTLTSAKRKCATLTGSTCFSPMPFRRTIPSASPPERKNPLSMPP